jgi:hypothetical protein
MHAEEQLGISLRKSCARFAFRAAYAMDSVRSAPHLFGLNRTGSPVPPRVLKCAAERSSGWCSRACTALHCAALHCTALHCRQLSEFGLLEPVGKVVGSISQAVKDVDNVARAHL